MGGAFQVIAKDSDNPVVHRSNTDAAYCGGSASPDASFNEVIAGGLHVVKGFGGGGFASGFLGEGKVLSAGIHVLLFEGGEDLVGPDSADCLKGVALIDKLVDRRGVPPMEGSRRSGALVAQGGREFNPDSGAGSKAPGFRQMRAGGETIEIIQVAKPHTTIGGGHQASPTGHQ